VSLDTVLARGRAKAEERMKDRCIIRRAGVVLYADQKCEVKQRTDDAAEAQDEADAYALDNRLVLKLPMSVTGLQPGDEAELTAAPRDPTLVGRVLRVQGFGLGARTVRRIFCTERTNAGVYLRGDNDGDWTT
jgi:hypothetical protein